MALEIVLTASLNNERTLLTVLDETGAYNNPDNLTGYGSPNAIKGRGFLFLHKYEEFLTAITVNEYESLDETFSATIETDGIYLAELFRVYVITSAFNQTLFAGQIVYYPNDEKYYEILLNFTVMASGDPIPFSGWIELSETEGPYVRKIDIEELTYDFFTNIYIQDVGNVLRKLQYSKVAICRINDMRIAYGEEMHEIVTKKYLKEYENNLVALKQHIDMAEMQFKYENYLEASIVISNGLDLVENFEYKRVL